MLLSNGLCSALVCVDVGVLCCVVFLRYYDTGPICLPAYTTLLLHLLACVDLASLKSTSFTEIPPLVLAVAKLVMVLQISPTQPVSIVSYPRVILYRVSLVCVMYNSRRNIPSSRSNFDLLFDTPCSARVE
ncbi:hypothetical protein GGR58DRAFT_458890 [Xylaria digitata]|nr:hypothetical protein GGR58DRAFT_458890 [Xylaria digitata]